MIVAAYLAVALATLSRAPRAALWLTVGGASFLASHIYWMSGAPHPIMVATMIDTVVVLLIYFRWRERWELAILVLFQIMLGLNFFRGLSELPERATAILPFSISQPTAAFAFELLNLAVIAIAGSTALLQRDGQTHGGGGDHRWLVPGLKRLALARRVDPPFTSR